MTGFMGFPFVEVLEIGGWCRDCTHAARRLTRFSGPGHYYSANHPNWSRWQELHLRPPRSERGRLLLTLHPEIGCQGWTRTNTERLNRPPCYFDTTWQLGIGAAGRICTCMGSFRRRMPRRFGHGSIWKWSARQELHLRSLGPKPSALAAPLRAVGPGAFTTPGTGECRTPTLITVLRQAQ